MTTGTSEPSGGARGAGGVGDIGIVVFDWGGVLLRICRGFEEGVRAAGLDLRELPRVNDELYSVRAKASLAYQVGEIGEDAFFATVVESLGGVYKAEEVAMIHDAWLLGEYPGVDAVVDGLHAAGVETGVLSNTNERHWRRGETDFPIAWRTRRPHASHLLGFAKPDEGIYRAFAEATGFGGREGEILFFDDLEENIEAARNCGWRAELIDHTGDTATQLRERLGAHGVPGFAAG